MFKNSIRKIFKIISVLIINSFIFGCASELHQHQDVESSEQELAQNPDRLLYSDRDHAVSKTTDDGLFRVLLYSKESPLPLKKIHSWIVHIETPDGEPLENAKVHIHGGMPAHRHDFPTKPRVTEYLGNGDYLVEGIKFSMPGHWQIRFNITKENRRDRVVFDVDL